MSKRIYFESMLKDIDLELSEDQYIQFDKYYNMLVERNKVMNLTTITEYKEVVLKHFIDSLSLIRIIDLNQDLTLIDVGTGAGFPGIPLKIVFPNLNIVLLDSLNKRVKFLEDVITELNLNKDDKVTIRGVHGRAEDLARLSEYRERFDICVSRAVSNLSTLSEYCLPFVKKGGSFISYKSGNIDEEINEAQKAIKLLGGKISKTDTFKLVNSDIDRKLVQIQKTLNTPKKYPRNPGTPKRDPIS